MIRSSIKEIQVAQTTKKRTKNTKEVPTYLKWFLEGFTKQAQESFDISINIEKDGSYLVKWKATIVLGILEMWAEGNDRFEITVTFHSGKEVPELYGGPVCNVVPWARQNLVNWLEFHKNNRDMQQYAHVLAAEIKKGV